MKTENAWEKYTKTQLEEVDALSKAYRAFLNHGKTERECVKQIVERAKEAGYKELSELIKEGKTCKPGDKVYAVNMEKAVILFQVGSEPLENGMNILGAHIDSPRLDVK